MMPASNLHSEQGVALLVTLSLLVAMLLLGASAARLALQGEQAARAERDRLVAYQAAEDALADAEHELAAAALSPIASAGSGGEGEGGDGAPGAPGAPGARQVAIASGDGFTDGCAAGGVNVGLCNPAAPGAPPVWQVVNIAADGAGDADATARSAEYGQFTGAAMETGEGFQPFRRPRYVIERLPYHPPGEDAAGPPRYLYRVTAIGFGSRPATEVVLQTTYRMADTGDAP